MREESPSFTAGRMSTETQAATGRSGVLVAAPDIGRVVLITARAVVSPEAQDYGQDHEGGEQQPGQHGYDTDPGEIRSDERLRYRAVTSGNASSFYRGARGRRTAGRVDVAFLLGPHGYGREARVQPPVKVERLLPQFPLPVRVKAVVSDGAQEAHRLLGYGAVLVSHHDLRRYPQCARIF